MVPLDYPPPLPVLWLCLEDWKIEAVSGVGSKVPRRNPSETDRPEREREERSQAEAAAEFRSAGRNRESY